MAVAHTAPRFAAGVRANQAATARYAKYPQAIHSDERTVERYPRILGTMGATDVRLVDGGREFRRFVDYAYEINASDPHWIPELRLSARERLTPKKNPFFAHADVALMLAWRDGAVVGRIAA